MLFRILINAWAPADNRRVPFASIQAQRVNRDGRGVDQRGTMQARVSDQISESAVLQYNDLWQCEQWRAGKIYESRLFRSREDAEMYARELGEVAPDLWCRIIPVDVKQVWN